MGNRVDLHKRGRKA